MAWNDLVEKTEELLDGLDLIQAPGIFTLELLPLTLMDKSYCVWFEELNPNSEMSLIGDQSFPLATFVISVSFELGDNITTLHNEAVEKIEDIYRTLIHPNNRSTNTRVLRFLGARNRILSQDGFWSICELRFQAEYGLNYNPDL